MYWLCITTRENWEIIKTKNVWGVSNRHRKTIKRVKAGDILVFYTKQEAKKGEKLPPMIVGIGEVIKEPYYDETEIFSGDIYPWRVNIKLVKTGKTNFKELIPKLGFIKNKDRWTLYLMGKAMLELSEDDYKIIEKSL